MSQITRGRSAAVALLLILAACSSQDGATTTARTDDRITSSTARQQTLTTIADPEPVALPAGVVWEGTTVDASEGALASSLIATEVGFIAAGNRTQARPDPQFGQSSQPVIYTSADALTWTAIELPAPNDRTYIADVALGPAGYVAVGHVGTGCRFACPNGYSVAWVSADGISWELVEPDMFRGGVRMSVNEVEVIGDTYLAIGKDEGGGEHWVTGVWTSTNGRGWQRVATLEDEYSLLNEALFVVGGRVFVSADEAVCSAPFTNADFGYVLGTWATETHLWSSVDGVAWEKVDVVAAGLTQTLPTDICEDSAFLAAEADDTTAADVTAIGDELWWRRQDGMVARWSGSSWLPVVLSEGVGDLTILAVPDGYLAMGVMGLQTGVIEFTAMTSADLATWRDWTDHTRRVVGLVPPDSQATIMGGSYAPVQSVAHGDTVVVLVAAIRQEPMTTAQLGLFAVVSTPAIAADECKPAPDVDCRHADLAGADLVDLDLSGIDLTGADLSGATLEGTDLTGAVLIGADLRSAQLSDVTLAGADLSHSSMDYAVLAASDLSRARLMYASLGGLEYDVATVLTGADLTHAYSLPLDLASSDAVLSGAEFGWWLDGPLDLSGARLAGTLLSGDLTGFSFVGADLASADLSVVTAVDADFTDAILADADLGADFSGARFAGAVLDGASWDGATCPDGYEVGYDNNPDCEGHFLDR